MPRPSLPSRRKPCKRPPKSRLPKSRPSSCCSRFVTSWPSRTRPATSCDSWCHSPIDLMIPAACGYAGGRFIWFAGDRVRWMVDKRLNTKKASDYSEAFNSVELRGFEPLTLSMPWRCATSCAIAPMSALQTLYKIQHRAESCNSRRVGHVVEESPGRMPHRLFRSVRPIA